jgi:hypothetical protein
MKLTANPANTERILFNDLGKVTKGVSPQELMVALDPGHSIYLPNSGEVMFSVIQGDARRYADHSMLTINDTAALANGASLVITHNFKYLAHINVLKQVGGAWLPVAVADCTISTNAAMTITTITNTSGGPLTFSVNIG